MLVDVHTHLIGVRAENGCYVDDRMENGLLYRFLKLTLGLTGVDRERLDEAYRDKLTDWAEGSDLDYAGVLALDGIYDDDGEFDREATSVLVGNDYCLEVCDASDVLLPICSVNPRRNDAMAELERVVDAGAVAIKLLPNSQGIDPANPEHDRFWERMSELNVPLLTHTSFEHTIPPVEQTYGEPKRLRRALEAGVTVIAAHCASAGVTHFTEHFDDWLAMLERFPNLYGDVSAMASVARFPYISRVLESDLARDRVALGSDFPIPVSPWLFLGELEWSRVMELSALDNPLQSNLETFRALGCDDAIFERGAEILRIPG